MVEILTCRCRCFTAIYLVLILFLINSLLYTAFVDESLIRTMDLVIDIQFVKGAKHNILPKEVAVVALNGDYHGHWVVQPSSNLRRLTANTRRENNWLTQQCHGFNYSEGEISLKALHTIVRFIAKYAGKIFVRGKDKWLTLCKIIPNEIINLEYDKKCPCFDKLSSNVYCIHDAVKFSSRKYRCALNNADRLKSYVCSRDSDLNTNLIDLNDGQSSNIGDTFTIPIAHCGCIPGRSDPTGVDQTDGICRKY